MSTDQTDSKRECRSDQRTSWGRSRLRNVLILVAVTIAAVGIAFRWTSPSRPNDQRLRSELETALDQVYRSFELDDEAATYDQIANRVTGDAVREIYLEVRGSLSHEDGSRVSIDRVQVDHVDRIQWHPDGGCQMDATWSVRGQVGHFGHSHERQNRYRARLELLLQAGVWKIRSIQITEQEREW